MEHSEINEHLNSDNTDISIQCKNTTHEKTSRTPELSPLLTILKLGFGPLLFSLISSLVNALDLYFVEDFYGQNALTTMSISWMIKAIPTSIGSFFQHLLIAAFNELITNRNYEKAAMLYVDLLKMAFIIGIVIPLPFMFALKPILKALGLPESLEKQSFGYLMPVLWHLMFKITFTVSIAAWISLKRIFGGKFIQLLAMFIWFFIDAILIYIFHVPIWSLGLSYISGTVLCTIFLLFRFFNRNEVFVPKLSYFVTKPIPEFWTYIKKCIPYSIQVICSFCNPLIIESFLASTSKAQKQDIVTIFATAQIPYHLGHDSIASFISGLNPCATLAYLQRNYSRFRKLSLWAMILPYLILAILWPMMVFVPNIIIGIWTLETVKPLNIKLVPKIFYTMLLDPVTETCSCLLNIFKREYTCSSAYIIKTIVLIISAVIFDEITHDPEKILFSIPISDAIYFLYFCSLLICMAKDIIFPRDAQQTSERSVSSASISPAQLL